MTFNYFFLVASALLLISALVVIRRREPTLRGFGLAVTLTTLVLLAGAVLRLTDPAAPSSQSRLLVDTITVADLSAATILLFAWTVRSWRAPR
jgi:hypothetical protein